MGMLLGPAVPGVAQEAPPTEEPKKEKPKRESRSRRAKKPAESETPAEAQPAPEVAPAAAETAPAIEPAEAPPTEATPAAAEPGAELGPTTTALPPAPSPEASTTAAPAAAPAAAPPAAPAQPTAATTVAAEPPRELTDEEEDLPMNWAGIGLRLGVMGIGKAKAEVGGVKSDIAKRTGFLAVVPINLGGSGIGWTIDPYYFNSTISHTIYSAAEGADGKKIPLETRDVSLHTLGIGGGPTILFHVSPRWFVGTAITARWGWSLNDTFQYAFDLYGRIPLQVTYYPIDKLGIVAELGIGYGGSGFANKPTVTRRSAQDVIQEMRDNGTFDPNNPLDPEDLAKVDADFQFGLAPTYDFSIGVRFP